MAADPRSEADIMRSFEALPDAAYVRLPTVALLFATSPSNVWRWVKRDIVPQPRRLAGRTTAWNVGELRRSLAAVGL
ncbi:hypothetical protein D3C80_388290 [compost metagenome]